MRKRAFINEKLNGGDAVDPPIRKSKWNLKNYLLNNFSKLKILKENN